MTDKKLYCGACGFEQAPTMIAAVYMMVPFCLECVLWLNIAGGCLWDQDVPLAESKPHEASH
jgi:hypothetical protein